ncbi:rhodanese-like domain-containing protein [bacterium]|nr:rhodanese-like domain-containing protein [bacterium]
MRKEFVLIATITPARLASLIDAGHKIVLIDVRTPAEYREMHVPIARLCPLDRLTLDNVQALAPTKTTADPVYTICRSGSRGAQACQQLGTAGMTNVINVEGGTLAWEAAGLPVVRGKKAISLERQVRIAAGTLVLLGSLLGYLVHPVWIGLAGFVGAGLVFAGITDTCGMGMILAGMPWNQVPEDTSTKDPSSATCSVR